MLFIVSNDNTRKKALNKYRIDIKIKFKSILKITKNKTEYLINNSRINIYNYKRLALNFVVVVIVIVYTIHIQY
jgi:hypothetical protein